MEKTDTLALKYTKYCRLLQAGESILSKTERKKVEIRNKAPCKYDSTA